MASGPRVCCVTPQFLYVSVYSNLYVCYTKNECKLVDNLIMRTCLVYD